MLAGQGSGDAVQQREVDVPGHDRHYRGITVGAWRRGGAAPGPGRVRPGGFRAGGAVQAAELIEGHMELDLGGLPGPLGQASRAREPAARLL